MKHTETLEISTPTEREVVLTRVFDAPCNLVFDALTRPELLRRWYAPPGCIGVPGLPLPPDGKNWGHAIEHVVVAGAIGFPIIGWLLGSLVLLATRKAPRPASA